MSGGGRTWPEWWGWDVIFTGHAELRMEQRQITEIDVRSMLQRADRYSSSIVTGRFMIETTHRGWAWTVIVEPDLDRRLLVVVTAYKRSE